MATSSDAEGKFQLEIEPNQVLLFSYVGFKHKEITIGSSMSITVELEGNEQVLEEVAVTAFGIQREVRSLGFATQNVKPKEISESNQPNLVNAIQGKVAGVQITNSGGSPGSSANIMIRGATSLSGNNQPLLVVDGIPIDNTTPVAQGGLTATEAPATNRGFDINPEDIQDLTVLKGPAAAALYGIRAASGAIVITTKRGAGGNATINYTNTFSLDDVNKLPEMQHRYKQGEQGESADNVQVSWGPSLSSSEPLYDNLGKFFKNGFAQNHDVSVSGSNEKSSVYTSAAWYKQNGIIKGNDYDRKSFRLSGDTKIGEKLKVGGTANYVKSDRTYFTQGSFNGAMGVYNWPVSDDMKNYLNPDGSQRRLDVTESGNDNPYWTIHNKPITSNVDRVIASGNISYDPVEWLNLTYRAGTDFYSEKFKSITMPGTVVQAYQNGYITEAATTNQITTSTFLATFKKDIKDDFHLSFTAGHNLETSFRETANLNGTEFVDPTLASINNVKEENRRTSKSTIRRRIIGVFGDFNADWKKIAFLNVRGRNDWSSTLPTKNNSFFYPSVSGSVILTDLLKELGSYQDDAFISYAKVRAAWAQVGKDALPHKLYSILGTYINDFTIDPRGYILYVNDYYGNPNQKPEFTNSYEYGAEVRFLNNRIGLDLTYYRTTSDDQILGTRTPPSSGAFLIYLNGGAIRNEGVEGILNITAIQKTDFSWNADINFSKNKATVLSLPGDLDRVELSDAWVYGNYAQGAAFLDNSVFGINGSVWKTNQQGQLLLDNDGKPQIAAEYAQIGDRNPDWLAGITNTFRYKDFTLSFMWDFRVGGKVFNATDAAMTFSGLSTQTLDRGTKVFDGIIESTGEQNTKAIELNQDFYQTLYVNNSRFFVENGGWARLRYASLTYSLPKRVINNIGLQNLSFTLTGRNLLLFTPYSGVDPEVSGSGAGVGGSGSFGFDNLGVPATKGVDLGLRVIF
ncbi:SusC/RagA family TonB-linked outer membrane protein [Olivibacter ginsenosidimutans]|uniref:SusC/RagA family TonB-linked outer membrane protein n=1 Tax=Olivibacter ginsenosidimutans TaxID=1176537 RepID=A0ABP9AZ61_9SPHI